MICISLENESLVKYHVSFDENKLDELRNEIINKCSIKEFYSYEDTIIPTSLDLFIKPYNVVQIGNVERNGKFTPLYKIDCYRIEYPDIIMIIDRIKKEDRTAISDLLNYEDTIKINYEEELVDLFKKLSQTENESKRIDILNEIESKRALIELNKDYVKASTYVPKIYELLVFNKVGKIQYTQLKKVQEFIESDEIEKSINKLLLTQKK
ncbi:MAG: hypothetical protein J5892_03805 [Bacilli bacterium]|nr:hypothetical protein [Bacilli bacterium]